MTTTPVQTQSAGPVVICCATDDEDKLVAVKQELESEGHLVEIVSGVQNDTGPLAAVIARFHGDGLYVLCRSRSLGREAVDKCRDVLLAHHVPFGRTLTVASVRSRELKDRIRAGLQRVAVGRARRMSHVEPEGSRPINLRATLQGLPALDEPSGRLPLRAGGADKPRRQATMIGLPIQTQIQTQTQTPGKPAPTPPSPAAIEDDAPSAPADRAPAILSAYTDEEDITNVSRNGPRLLDHEESTSNNLGEAAEQTAVTVAPSGGSEDTSVGNPFARERYEETAVGFALDEVSGETSLVERPTPGLPSFYEAVQAVESERISVEDMQSVIEEARAAKAAAEAQATDSLGSMEVIRPEDLADLDGSGPMHVDPLDRSEVRLRETIAGLRREDTAVGSMPQGPRAGNTVRTPSLPIDDDAVTRPTPKRTLPPPAPRHVAPAPAGMPSPMMGASMSMPAATEERGPPWLAIGLGAAALVVGGIAVAFVMTRGGNEPSAADGGALASAETSQSPRTEAARLQGATAGGETADPKRALEADVARAPGLVRTKVMDALRSRKVRSLDVLLVTADAAGPMSFDEARAHCQDLDIEGLGGWRLPEIGELSSLANASMVGRGFTWSATGADTFGDVHLSYWGRRDRVLPREDPSFVTCVRGDRVGQ